MKCSKCCYAVLVGITACIKMLSQEKGLGQLNASQFPKFDHMILYIRDQLCIIYYIPG